MKTSKLATSPFHSSNYSNGGPITIPIAAGPTLSVNSVTVGSGDSAEQELRVGWSGLPSDYQGGISVQVLSVAFPGNGWNTVWYGDQGSGAWPFNVVEDSTDTTDQGNILNPGVFGRGTYDYRISAVDSYNHSTLWSNIASGTIGDGSAVPAPQLSVDGTSISATWPAGDELLYAADGSSYVIGNGDPLPHVPGGVLDTSTGLYTTTLNNLNPGTKYDFSLWTPLIGSGESEASQFTFGSASKTTTGTASLAAPAAPASPSATFNPANDQQVFLHWQNTSNNETNFVLLRSVDGGSYERISPALGADVTSFTDDDIPYDSDGNAELDYEVEAESEGDGGPPATSQPTPAAPVNAEEVTVTSITVKVIPKPDNPEATEPQRNDYDGYAFYDEVDITGTHLDKVRLTQTILAKTTVTDYAGNALTKKDLIRAYPKFNLGKLLNSTGGKAQVDDGWDGVAVQGLNASNTTGDRIDRQSFNVVPGSGAFGGVNVCDLADVNRSFEITACSTDAPPKKLKSVTWSYDWNNQSCIWKNTDMPPFTPGSCAAQNKNNGKGTYSDDKGIDGLADLNK